ncbi:MAG: hypothetical protein ONB42_15875, partial [candidate division KSB1 bacterium]|nr:hypothetical protein [candidate division KSB1 bacterium]
MRTTSVTTHTFWNRIGQTPNGCWQALFKKSAEQVRIQRRNCSNPFLYWLARGFVLGALCCSIIAGFIRVDSVFGQSRLSKTNSTANVAAVTKFEDTFNSGKISANWVAHPAYVVKVVKSNGQLVNSSTVDAWDGFAAIPKVITNPNIVKIVYGDLSDEVGRAFTGIAMMLDRPDTTADGYLIFHNDYNNQNRVRLWKLTKCAPVEEIDAKPAALPGPIAGDTLTVEFAADDTGHHFRVLINGKEDAILDDPYKVRGNKLVHYAGIMTNGNTKNAVDYFQAVRTIDIWPPEAVTSLQVASVFPSTISLRWQAPGDDGNKDTAKSYDLRYSTQPINDANFDFATRVTAVPTPSPAGTMETVAISGLKSGTTYYFALKTADEVGNVSDLSNVVSATTPLVNAIIDDFNRAGPGLGSRWQADPNLQIVNNAVQNTAAEDVWSIALFAAGKNPSEVSFKWGPNATAFGTNYCGLLVMATGEVAAARGYMIQYSQRDNYTRLWHILDGRIEEIIDEGPSIAPPPKAGSVMRVEISSDASGHRFMVYIDDQPDRVLTDPNKVEGTSDPVYAGFILESTLDEQNAIDEFRVVAPIGKPAKLNIISGNNQNGPIGEQLPEPLVVAVLDDSDNPVPNILVDFFVTDGDAVVSSPNVADGHIRIEAETAKITGPMAIRNDDNAAGSKYIVYPPEATLDASATFTVNIAQAGSYLIWTRSLKTGSDAGSWFVSVDGGPELTYDVFRAETREAWDWDLLSDRGNGSANRPEFDPKIFEWTAGNHTITFKARYADTRLDKILITADLTYVPDGKEEPGFKTDNNGLARALVTFGQKAGTASIQARYAALTPVTFTVRSTGGAAAKIERTSPTTTLSGAAGQQLAQPFVVTVRDANNNLVANYPVNWVVTLGNGKLVPYASITDLNGQAKTFLILGNQSATNKVEARAPITGSPIEFVATTTSGLAASTSIVSGNTPQQTATVRSALPNPLVVKVSDANSVGVANYPVEFVITRGGGSSTASQRVANPGFEVLSGTAPANWTLEGTPSATEVQVSTTSPHGGTRSLNVNTSRSGVGVTQAINYQANTGYTLTFYAKVLSGTARMIWQMDQEEVIDMTPASTQSNWQFYTIYATSVSAGSRNLSFKSNGASNFFVDDIKILPNTGSNGQASIIWTMGDTAMVQQGQVMVMNGALHLTGSPLNFSAKANAGSAATLSKQSGDNQAGTAGQALPAPFVVKVTDFTGINGVQNVDVTFE